MSTVKSKKCSKCGQDKPLTEFYKRNASKDGLRSDCKSCAKESVNKYLEANKEARKEYGKKYYEANKEARKEYGKKYYEANKEAVKKYREANKEAIKEINRRYREANKEAIKEINRRYREANKEAIKEYKKRYLEENKEAIKEYFNKYKKERYANDPEFRTSCLLREQTRRLGDYKNTNTIELVGCSPKEFWVMNGSPSIEELEDLHIDHIIPLSWFDLSNEGHVKVSNHYLNLQYLNSEDNISKNDRYAGRPDNILGYKGEFDVDAHVSEMLVIIESLK